MSSREDRRKPDATATATPDGPGDRPIRGRHLRFTGLVVLILTLQMAALFNFSRPASATLRHDSPPPRRLIVIPGSLNAHLRTAADQAQDRSGLLLPSRDPALASTPHPWGFSRSVWDRHRPPARPTPPWTESSGLLTNQPTALGRRFHALTEQTWSAIPLSTKVQERIQATVTTPTLPRTAETAIHIMGPVADRPLRRGPLHAPVLQHTNILRPTIVTIGVNALGQVVSRRIVTLSGLAEADQQALAITKSFRFQPDPRGNPGTVTWGRVAFEWMTRPVTTDSPPTPEAAPSPDSRQKPAL